MSYSEKINIEISNNDSFDQCYNQFMSLYHSDPRKQRVYQAIAEKLKKCYYSFIDSNENMKRFNISIRSKEATMTISKEFLICCTFCNFAKT